MIETEYVLVTTAGLDPISIDQLATVKWPNPFKGLIDSTGTVVMGGSTFKLGISPEQQHIYAAPGQEKPVDPVEPDKTVATNGTMAVPFAT